jgi:hypothetical protein
MTLKGEEKRREHIYWASEMIHELSLLTRPQVNSLTLIQNDDFSFEDGYTMRIQV